MAHDPSWRPAFDEVTIFKERTWLAGMFLTVVAYGIVFTLFTLSFAQLVRITTRQNYSRRLGFIIYISLMFILGTLFAGAIAKMTQLSFIAAFEEQLFSIPIDEISNVMYVIANWLADGMVLYTKMFFDSPLGQSLDFPFLHTWDLSRLAWSGSYRYHLLHPRLGLQEHAQTLPHHSSGCHLAYNHDGCNMRSPSPSSMAGRHRSRTKTRFPIYQCSRHPHRIFVPVFRICTSCLDPTFSRQSDPEYIHSTLGRDSDHCTSFDHIPCGARRDLE